MKCKICLKERKYEAFGMCKSCYMKEYRKNYSKKKNRESSKRAYEKNKEYSIKKSKKWHRENLEKARLKGRVYYSKNREEAIKRVLKYIKTPEGKMSSKLIKARRYALKKQVQHSFSNEDWKLILEKTQGICPSCEKDVGIMKMTLDHIIPINSREKLVYTIKDVQPLCRSCNSSKGVKILNKIGSAEDD